MWQVRWRRQKSVRKKYENNYVLSACKHRDLSLLRTQHLGNNVGKAEWKILQNIQLRAEITVILTSTNSIGER